MKNYFRILGVHRRSTVDELKEARRRVAEQHHPDKGGDLDKMVEANEAYATLFNKVTRRAYDILVEAEEPCDACEGKGFTKKRKGKGFGASATTTPCAACAGAGHIWSES